MLRTFDYQCGICGRTKLLVDSDIPEAPKCCESPMGEYKWKAPYTPSLHKNDRPVVWQHPKTGEVRHPGRNDTEMPKYYKDMGYERKEFDSYRSHQKFCDEKGLVNHAAEGIK